jgi:hypothetical protein
VQVFDNGADEQPCVPQSCCSALDCPQVELLSPEWLRTEQYEEGPGLGKQANYMPARSRNITWWLSRTERLHKRLSCGSLW